MEWDSFWLLNIFLFIKYEVFGSTVKKPVQKKKKKGFVYKKGCFYPLIIL